MQNHSPLDWANKHIRIRMKKDLIYSNIIDALKEIEF